MSPAANIWKNTFSQIHLPSFCRLWTFWIKARAFDSLSWVLPSSFIWRESDIDFAVSCWWSSHILHRIWRWAELSLLHVIWLLGSSLSEEFASWVFHTHILDLLNTVKCDNQNRCSDTNWRCGKHKKGGGFELCLAFKNFSFLFFEGFSFLLKRRRGWGNRRWTRYFILVHL